jgi:hypothetical protein
MQTSNPLLQQLKLPGRTFQLPSRGALYQDGEISNADGEVHVHPLSALTEISLKNPDLLFNGKALEQVCAECVPDIKKPLQLYGRDIDALMFFIRLVTYGPEFQVTYKHTCEHAKQHSYVIDIEKMVQEIKPLDPTIDYTVTLPNGQRVKLQPIKFEHIIKMYQMNAGKKELEMEDMKQNILFNMQGMIHSVDDVVDREFIKEWCSKLTTPYQMRITEMAEKMNNWGPRSSAILKCKDCGEEVDVELPLNPISFFTE